MHDDPCWVRNPARASHETVAPMSRRAWSLSRRTCAFCRATMRDAEPTCARARSSRPFYQRARRRSRSTMPKSRSSSPISGSACLISGSTELTSRSARLLSRSTLLVSGSTSLIPASAELTSRCAASMCNDQARLCNGVEGRPIGADMNSRNTNVLYVISAHSRASRQTRQGFTRENRNSGVDISRSPLMKKSITKGSGEDSTKICASGVVLFLIPGVFL